VLIFGSGAVEANMSGVEFSAHLSLIGAFLLVTIVFAPWAAAWSLRVSLE
jgi:heme exporter protein B